MYKDKGIDHTLLLLIHIPIFLFRLQLFGFIRRVMKFLKLINSYKSKYFDDNWEPSGTFDEGIG